jgi:putative transposase
MVTASQRGRAVQHLKNRRFSESLTCRVVGFSRSAVWSLLKGRNGAALRVRLTGLAEQYPRYGDPRLQDMLRAADHVANHERGFRIHREQRLQERTKRRKKVTRPRVPMLVPDNGNQRWSTDFVSGQLRVGGRR